MLGARVQTDRPGPTKPNTRRELPLAAAGRLGKRRAADPREVADQVGAWNENIFLYSEETSICGESGALDSMSGSSRRPVCRPSWSDSFASPGLAALMAVNRVRLPNRPWTQGRSRLPGGCCLLRGSQVLRSPTIGESAIRGEQETVDEFPSATYPSGDLDAKVRGGDGDDPACNEESVIVRP